MPRLTEMVAARRLKLWVHLLDSGLPLCRFSVEVPAKWPSNHKWVSIVEYIRGGIGLPKASLCETCREAYEEPGNNPIRTHDA